MYTGNNKKIVATVEARMTSSRLPGKVLFPLAGKPALERLLERVRTSAYVDEIVVATTTNHADDPIVSLAKRLNVTYFRGSEDDVLSRVLLAAQSVQGDIIVEITGDCPLVNGELVDRGIEEFFSHDVDYASNTLPRSYPDGFDVQVFPVAVLAEVDKLTQDPIDRVHVSLYLYSHPERFALHGWLPKEHEHFWPDLRVTLDEKADYELVGLIFERLLPVNKNFGVSEVLTFLRNNPQLLTINKHVKTKKTIEG
ncbi:MAG: glycosyltransferase family protein [bacterium]|nr:glycosyltransferase family protein [bacterium]